MTGVYGLLVDSPLSLGISLLEQEPEVDCRRLTRLRESGGDGLLIGSPRTLYIPLPVKDDPKIEYRHRDTVE